MQFIVKNSENKTFRYSDVLSESVVSLSKSVMTSPICSVFTVD